MITASQLRANFSEFGDRTVYPDSMINFWLVIAYVMVNQNAWGTQTDLGAQLFTMHNMVLEKQAIDAAAFGGAPGVSTGPVHAKAVDKVSIGYDSASGLDMNGSHWNLTVYGTRFLRLSKIFGAGVVQVNGPSCAFEFGFGPGPYSPQW